MLAVKAGTLDQGLPTPNSIPGSEQPNIINNLRDAVDRNKPVNFPELQLQRRGWFQLRLQI